MPKKVKELNFWHTYNHEDERAILKWANVFPTTIKEYEQHFDHKRPNQICGEASPSYLIYYKDTIDNLKTLHANWGEIKIIIILREPIDKIWSHYKFSKNHDLDPLDLSLPQTLKLEGSRINDISLLPDLHFVHNTRYFDQVKYYQEYFDNVKVLLYDDLKKNSQTVLDEITDFLEIARFVPDNADKVFNASRRVYKPNKIVKMTTGSGLGKYLPRELKGCINYIKQISSSEEKMDAKTEMYLRGIFRPEIEKLNTIIEPDLTGWLKKYD
jgi:hypothetical protein